MITEYKHLSRDTQLSIVTRNCQICIVQLDTLKSGIFKSKELMNGIIIRRNHMQQYNYAVYLYILLFQRDTDPELSISLYMVDK